MNYKVEKIEVKMAHDFIMNKHYAHAMPAGVEFVYGLYNDRMLGVCLYGSSANRQFNKPELFFNNVPNGLKRIYELTRLVTVDNLPENTLSFFVSNTLKKLKERSLDLKSPIVIVSYADANVNHHGYIYQATNWIYTGMSKPDKKFVDEKGNRIHRRTMYSRYGTSSERIAKEKKEAIIMPGSIPNIEPEEETIKFDIEYDGTGKHRYFYFIGTKKQVRKLKNEFILDILPYPKGDNKKYKIDWSEPHLKFFERK